MTEKYIHKLILIFTSLAIVGSGTYAMAKMGMSHKYGGHHGPGEHHRGYGSQGYGGYWGNLSDTEKEQMQAERTAFFEATKEIRQQLYQKRLELASELAKKALDPEKAIGLQKEISGLRSQIEMKRLDFILKLKKINSDVGRGLMGRGRWEYRMKGSGRYMGPGMGPRGSGRDYSRQHHGMQKTPKE